MISSWRTYRSLRVLVAFAFLLGVSAPLVHHVCAMAGEAMTAPHGTDSQIVESAHASDHVEASCVYGDHAGGHDPLCVDVQRVPSGCEMTLCTFESNANEHVLAVSAEGPSVRLDLVPALAADQILPPTFVSSRPLLQESVETVGARDLVSVRLLTSTFLL